jgi:hypothetical protein
MNALAEDQLSRLRSLLAGTGIGFGIYIGKTPGHESDVAGNNPDAAREFASRFFGVPEEEVVTVSEAYEREVWADTRVSSPAPVVDPAYLLNECVRDVLGY